MRTFSITHLKGGVGKTTTTLVLAGLLQARGFRVLVVDLDPQASLTAVLGHVPEALDRGTHGLFTGAPIAIADAVRTQHGFDLLPTSPALARAERMPERPDGLGGVLAAALRTVATRYHFALIDCPPALGVLQVNAIAAAERLIVPVQCEHLAVEGLRRLDATLAMIARSRGGRVPARLIVPTMVDFRTRAAHFALRLLREHWGHDLWRGHIPEDTALRDAARLQRMPHEYAPRSRAVLAYANLMVDLLTDRGAWAPDAGAATPVTSHWRAEGAVL
jgi:chromosome partitioning protein